MAVGKRRTRPLTVKGQSFRWRCEFSEPAEQFSVGYAERGASWAPDRLFVRPTEGAHRVLTVTWPACRGPIVRPGLVRACVEEALRRRWLASHAVMTLAGTELPVVE